MIWQVLADLHGAHEALQTRVDLTRPLLMLGDNVNLVDFHTLTGVAARVLGKGDIARILLALTTGGPRKAREMADRLFFNNPERIAEAREVVREEYRELAGLLPESFCHVLHGNVDWPDLLGEALGARHVHATCVEYAGRRIGLVSGTGSYRNSMKLPGELDDAQYTAALNSIGAVDILCTHFPPALEGLTWDTVAKRDEGGGKMLTEYLGDVKPALHLFGHIHNPRERIANFGPTRLVNVGGFRYHRQVWELDLTDLRIAPRPQPAS